MITLTDWKTEEPVMLDSKEIGAIKPVYCMGCVARTIIFVITDSGVYDHRVVVSETPDEIAKLIMAPLLEAGEQIRI